MALVPEVILEKLEPMHREWSGAPRLGPPIRGTHFSLREHFTFPTVVYLSGPGLVPAASSDA